MAILDPIRDRVKRGSERRIRDASSELLKRLSDAAPTDTNEMRDSIIVSTSGLTVTVAVPVDHASFTNADTEPHLIEGNPILAFLWPARGPGTFFFAHVDHPGTQGVVDWYGNTLDEWPKILERQKVV